MAKELLIPVERIERSIQLTRQEFTDLKCQIGISSSWGGRRTPPWAFTEQGLAMLSGVLQSERAIKVNIAIMRAFVRLREILATHKDLAHKLDEHERRLGEHDHQIQVVFDAIRQLMTPPPAPKKRRIGFGVSADEEASTARITNRRRRR